MEDQRVSYVRWQKPNRVVVTSTEKLKVLLQFDLGLYSESESDDDELPCQQDFHHKSPFKALQHKHKNQLPSRMRSNPERYFTSLPKGKKCQLCGQLQRFRLPCECVKYCDYCLSPSHLKAWCSRFTCAICFKDHLTRKCYSKMNFPSCNVCFARHPVGINCLVSDSLFPPSKDMSTKIGLEELVCYVCGSNGHIGCKIDDEDYRNQLFHELNLRSQYIKDRNVQRPFDYPRRNIGFYHRQYTQEEWEEISESDSEAESSDAQLSHKEGNINKFNFSPSTMMTSNPSGINESIDFNSPLPNNQQQFVANMNQNPPSRFFNNSVNFNESENKSSKHFKPKNKDYDIVWMSTQPNPQPKSTKKQNFYPTVAGERDKRPKLKGESRFSFYGNEAQKRFGRGKLEFSIENYLIKKELSKLRKMQKKDQNDVSLLA